MPVLLPAHLDTLSKCPTPDAFKDRVWQLLGDAIKDYEVTGTDVLFVTYIEPEQTAGGLYKPQQSQQEILFQGTVGLVVGAGPLVGKYDGAGKAWLDVQRTPKLNDWIVVRFADCWEMHLDGMSCRLVDPENIRGFIKRPEIITHRPIAKPSALVRAVPVPSKMMTSTSMPASTILRG